MIKFLVKIASQFGINPKEAERFVKFLVVGTIGFVVDFGTLSLLIWTFKLEPQDWGIVIANTISFTCAVISNFTFNRYWTYPDSRNKQIGSQLVQFGLVSLVGLLINNIIFGSLVVPFDTLIDSNMAFAPLHGFGYIPAKIIATLVVLFWNFFVNRYWTYNDVDKIDMDKVPT